MIDLVRCGIENVERLPGELLKLAPVSQAFFLGLEQGDEREGKPHSNYHPALRV